MSKRNWILVAGVASLVLTSAAFADYQFMNNYNRVFVDVGTDAYYLNNHVFNVGTRGTTNAPLGKIDNNGFTPRYNFALGYQFLSCADCTLSRIFGNEQAVLVKGSYFNTDQTTREANLGEGSIWMINGGGNLILGGGTYDIANFKLQAHNRSANLGLYFQGHRYTTNPNLTLNPYVGLVYDNEHEFYQYELLYDQYVTPRTDLERYDLKADYYGVSLGNRIDYSLIKQLSVFADLEAQFLHVNATLNAEQYPGGWVAQQTRYTAHDTDNMPVTYRAILSAGINYKFTSNPNSPSVELKGGLDRWGYVPVVVTPDASNQEAAHIHGETQNNTFVGINFHVPLPF